MNKNELEKGNAGNNLKTGFLTVTCTGGKKTAKIAITGNSLIPLGFEHDVLVQAFPVPNGMDFLLCDSNIHKYSDLVREIKEKGGKLVQVFEARKDGEIYPSLITTGDYILNTGLSYGDSLIVRYAYGNIQVRKFDFTKFHSGKEHTYLLHVGYKTCQKTKKSISIIRLSGKILSQHGFEPDALVSVSAESGVLTFNLEDEGIGKYSEIVKMARQKRQRLAQVRNMHGTPYIGLSGSILKRAEFETGDVFVACCKHGQIEARKVDLEQFHFS